MPSRRLCPSLCVVFGLWRAAAAGVAEPVPRLIILGFDGVDAGITEAFLDQGKLPHLQALAARGGYARLAPTVPAQTPVSWATFITDRDPGGTQIVDYLKRDTETYLPTFAVADEGRRKLLFGGANRLAMTGAGALAVVLLAIAGAALLRRRRPWLWAAPLAVVAALAGWVVGGWIPSEIPTVTNRRAGTPFWQIAGESGQRATVARLPVTFPATPFPGGHLLAGLGVPDLRGRIGTPALYTSDPTYMPATDNEFSVEIVHLPSRSGVIETTVIGPPNRLFKEPPRIEVPLTLTVAADRSTVTLATCGQRHVLRAGEWTPYLHLVFPFNPLVKAHGQVRFKLLSIDPEVRLYLAPINFDPRHTLPGFDLSAPRGWAGELFDTLGPYKTVGWAIDTWTPTEKMVDEETFMEDLRQTVAEHRRILDAALASGDRLVVHYFEYTDRVGHLLWRGLDERHPAHRSDTALQLRAMFEEAYGMMDAIVGEVAAALGPEDILIVLSDHGFSTWRRSFHVNTWLAREGYIGLTGGSGQLENLENLFDRGEFWPNVDWRRTRAYHLGLGGLYINLAGREKHGVVAPGREYETLRRELAARLAAVVDPETGEHPVSRVFLREEVYRTFDPQLIPDLIVTTSRGWRISWQSALGGMPDRLFEDNDRVWSADHCTLDPAVVPGVLFSSKPLARPQVAMIDLYPTILGLLGLEPSEEVAGTAFLAVLESRATVRSKR